MAAVVAVAAVVVVVVAAAVGVHAGNTALRQFVLSRQQG